MENFLLDFWNVANQFAAMLESRRLWKRHVSVGRLVSPSYLGSNRYDCLSVSNKTGNFDKKKEKLKEKEKITK